MSRTAEIRIAIELDDENIPTHIAWDASDANGAGPKAARSMMLSLWDSENSRTVAIDLWTREMTVEEMNRYCCQVLHKLADTYERATHDAGPASKIHEFGEMFATEVDLGGPEAPTGENRSGQLRSTS